MMRNDITGATFGNLTAIEPTSDRKRNQVVWIFSCNCGCGKNYRIGAGDAKAGANPCRRGINFAPRVKTPGFASYRSMIARCYYPSCKDFNSYGARGITVCDRWRYGENGATGIDCFFADMGTRPDGASLDRIDGRLGYTPDNCRWATVTAQARNRKDNVTIEYAGRTMTVAEAAELSGINFNTLKWRVRNKPASEYFR